MEAATNDSNVYVLLLLGMIAVGAHAYNLFNQPIDRPSTSTRWRFLSTIPIQLATTQSRFRLGLVVYIIVFELIYLVLSSSSSLLLMAYQVSGRQDLTGALSESVSPNSTVPILASTGLILLTQIRPFSQVEMMLRRFAHRMARVPDGLKMVKLRVSGYLSTTKLTIGKQILEDLAFIDKLTDESTSDRLIKSQINIAWLFENTLGAKGSMAWDEEGSDELLQLFLSARFEVPQLQNDIASEAQKPAVDSASPSAGTPVPKTQVQGTWQELLKRSLHLEERLTLLLCLLLINQPNVDTKNDKTLEKLIERTRQREQSEVADIAIRSTIYGAIACVVLLFCYERIESGFRSDLSQSPYSAKAPFGDYITARLDSNENTASLYPFAGLTGSEQQQYAISSGIQFDLQDSINETLWTAIAFLSAVLVALSLNTHHITVWRGKGAVPPIQPEGVEKSGERYGIKSWTGEQTLPEQSPVTATVHYLLISFVACIAAAATLFIYLFISKALLPALSDNIDVLSYEIMGPFRSMLSSIMRLSLAAAVCAVFVIWLDGLLTRRPLSASLKLPRPRDLPSTLRFLASLPPVIARALSSVWIICALTAFAISILVLVASIVIGQNTEVFDAVGRFSSTFLSFLSFLLPLAVVMQLHPGRYASEDQTQISSKVGIDNKSDSFSDDRKVPS